MKKSYAHNDRGQKCFCKYETAIPYEEYQVMKYNQLAKALEASKPAPKTYDEYLELCNEEYESYCEQMEKEMDDYISQIDQDDLPW